MDKNDTENVQAHRLTLLRELCDNAYSLAMQSLDQEQEVDILRVFDLALCDCLAHDSYTKDDLATVWAMLQLGSRSIRKISLSTDSFNLGTPRDAQDSYKPNR